MATVRLRYVGAIDQIDLPVVGLSLARGDEFDGPKELLEQVDNYELAEKPTAKAKTTKAGE